MARGLIFVCLQTPAPATVVAGEVVIAYNVRTD